MRSTPDEFWSACDQNSSAVAPQSALERALERAEAQRIVDHAELAALLARRRSHPGARKLAALRIDDEPHLTRSGLEDRFLELLARDGLPKPLVNHRVLDYEVDVLWPVHRLIVEADTLRCHGTPAAFERDRRRDIELKLAGYHVARLTDRDIARDADRAAATVRALLLQSCSRRSPAEAATG